MIAKAPLQYIETHDHARFICQYGLSHGDGSELLREGDRNQRLKVQPYLIGTLLARGVPLLWQGQERMENYWLPEQGRTRVALNMGGQAQWAPFWFPIAGNYVEQLHGVQEPQLNLNGVTALQETWLAIPANYGRVWSTVKAVTWLGGGEGMQGWPSNSR